MNHSFLQSGSQGGVSGSGLFPSECVTVQHVESLFFRRKPFAPLLSAGSYLQV